MRRVTQRVTQCVTQCVTRRLERLHAWRACETHCVDLYVVSLANIGCWPSGDGAAPRSRFHPRWWLPRFSLVIMSLTTFLLGPLSVYQLWDGQVTRSLHPAIGTFVTGMMILQMSSLLHHGERFSAALSALHAMRRCARLHLRRPAALRSATRTLDNLTLLYFTVCLYVVKPVALVALPVYSYVSRKFVLRYWYPYDETAAPACELTLLVLYVASAFGVHLMVVVNVLLMALLVQALAQLKLLNHNLRSIRVGRCAMPRGRALPAARASARQVFVNVDICALRAARRPARRRPGKVVGVGRGEESHEKTHSRGNREAEERLRVCVLHHQAISRFMERLVAAFDLILFHQYNCTICPLILSIVLVTHVVEYDVASLVVAVLILFCLLDQVIFCWLADQLSHESAQVREAVFACDWLEASDGFKRSMRIIMSRSNQPMVVKFAGFIPLNMETFTAIVKITYTYYMSLTKALERSASLSSS